MKERNLLSAGVGIFFLSPKKKESHPLMPYLIIIIDELAELDGHAESGGFPSSGWAP